MHANIDIIIFILLCVKYIVVEIYYFTFRSAASVQCFYESDGS